jgi:hypothetical protein
MAVKKQRKKEVRTARPRTFRLLGEDEAWVLELAARHPRGMSGVVTDALHFYRGHIDVQRRQLLESVPV